MEAHSRRAAAAWQRVLLGVLAFIATPFLVTGIYRLLPEGAPFWLWSAFPFAALGLLAVALWFFHSVPRPVSVGIVVGLLAHAVFLMFLFTQLGASPQIP